MIDKKGIKKSIHGRLKNWAKKNNESVENTLYRYTIERLLYRLSQSKYKNQFLLKGAFLFTLWFDAPHRTTRDVDFLNTGTNDIKELERIFKDVCIVKVVEDGLTFEPETIRVEPIMEESFYGGIRVRMLAILDKARMLLQIDIGCGDAVTPAPIQSKLPTILKMPAPRLRTYPIYTVIAEKLETMILRGLGNSRMKDIYDIWFLSKKLKLEGKALLAAVINTFKRRKTPFPSNKPLVLSQEFYLNPEKQIQWNAFLKRNKFTSDEIRLEPIISSLNDFLDAPLTAASLGRSFSKTWSNKKGWHEVL